MKRITQAEAIARLMAADVRIGSHVRVRYRAGRVPSERARQEAQVAVDRGLNLEVFTGSLESIGLNKRNEFYFTLFVVDRNALDAQGNERRGQFRAFNPSLGELYGLRVVR